MRVERLQRRQWFWCRSRALRAHVSIGGPQQRRRAVTATATRGETDGHDRQRGGGAGKRTFLRAGRRRRGEERGLGRRWRCDWERRERRGRGEKRRAEKARAKRADGFCWSRGGGQTAAAAGGCGHWGLGTGDWGGGTCWGTTGPGSVQGLRARCAAGWANPRGRWNESRARHCVGCARRPLWPRARRRWLAGGGAAPPHRAKRCSVCHSNRQCEAPCRQTVGGFFDGAAARGDSGRLRPHEKAMQAGCRQAGRQRLAGLSLSLALSPPSPPLPSPPPSPSPPPVVSPASRPPVQMRDANQTKLRTRRANGQTRHEEQYRYIYGVRSRYHTRRSAALVSSPLHPPPVQTNGPLYVHYVLRTPYTM